MAVITASKFDDFLYLILLTYIFNDIFLFKQKKFISSTPLMQGVISLFFVFFACDGLKIIN